MATGPVSDDELLTLWQSVTQGLARTQAQVDEQIEQGGVSAQWFAVLHLLLEAPGRRLPMSRLARDLSMTSGGFTKLADRMARDGLIDRRGSSADRRVVYATLTELGVRTARRMATEYVRALRGHVLAAVSDSDLRAMSAVAAALAEHNAARDDEDSGGPQPSRDPALPDRRSRRGETSRNPAPSVRGGRRAETSRDPALPERRGRGRATV